MTDSDSTGCGVRVLVDGSWGFAATRTLTKDGVTAAAREAIAVARASRGIGGPRVELAPSPAYRDVTWSSGAKIDPWSVPVEEKVDLLLRANAAALAVPQIRFISTSMQFVKEERHYANTDGTTTTQTVIRSWVPVEVTAVTSDRTDFASRANVLPPVGRGYEYVLESDLVGSTPKWAAEAVEKLKAKPVEVGRWDLVLHPSQLFLTIHESMGHTTELDRALGYEANYAGTSFLAPPSKVLGTTRLGPDFVNFRGDRSQPGGLATIGWDDDGVRPEDFDIVRRGVFVDYQTTREQAARLADYYARVGKPVRSHGCSYADSWASVPFQRMPNVSLLPGDKDLGWNDLISATDKGIAMIGRASYSIDQQRYNAQFGAQICYEIRGGKIVGQLRDVAYQMRTPDFWNAMDMLGGRRDYQVWGTMFDGKGEPPQVNAVSHGCPPARFHAINVINTGRAT